MANRNTPPPDIAAAISFGARIYGANEDLLRTIAYRESGYRPAVQNNWDSNAAKGTPSSGLFQFIPSTFSAFARQAKAANPQAWRGIPMNRNDPRAASLAAAWAFTHGKAGHWTTAQGISPQAWHSKHGGKAGGGASMPAYAPPPSAGSPMSEGDPIIAGILAKRGLHPLIAQDIAVGNPTGGNLAGGPIGAQPVAQAPGGRDVGRFRFLPRKPGEPGYRYLQRLGATGGLRNDPGNSQTFGGRHVSGSDHYASNAVDFGDAKNPDWLLDEWDRFLQQNSKPIGIKQTIWRAPGHYDHHHAAVR